MLGADFWNRAFYWMPPSIERELAALPTAEEQRAARRRIWRRMMKHWQTWVVIIGAIVACVGVLTLLRVVALKNRAWLGWTVRYPLPVALALGLVTGFVMTWIMSRALRRELRKLLIERGIEVCHGCGYRLAGNTSGRCPECGAAAAQ